MNVKNLKKPSKTDWKRLASMKDKDIDTSDIPPLDEDFFKKAEIRIPENKESVTIRIDKKVLKWFRSKGKGYQTRINAILKSYMKAHC